MFPELFEDKVDFRKVKFFENSQYLKEIESSQLGVKKNTVDSSRPDIRSEQKINGQKIKRKPKIIHSKPKKLSKLEQKLEEILEIKVQSAENKQLTGNREDKQGLIIESELLKEEIFKVEIMKTQKLFQTIYLACCFLSGGLLVVINHWLRNYLFIFSTHVEVEKLADGNSVIIRSKENKIEIAKLAHKRVYITTLADFNSFVFEFRGSTYFWQEETQTFVALQPFARTQVINEYVNHDKKGRWEAEIPLVRLCFKSSQMDFKRSFIYKKIKHMFLSPLSVAEMVFIILLIHIEFYFYALILSSFLVLNICILVKSEMTFEENIRATFRQTQSLTLWRKDPNGNLHKTISDSRDVILGDVVELTNGMHTTFDLMLIQGECFAKDSNTGRESREFKIHQKKAFEGKTIRQNNLIQAGSQVLTNLNDVNGQCLALVLGTGLNTQNGLEIKRILNNSGFKVPNKNEIYMLFQYFLLLGLVMCFTLILLDHFLDHPILAFRYTFSKLVRILLVCFKPTLPLAIFASFLFSERRLQNLNIQTRNRSKIVKCNQTNQFFIEKNIFVAKDFLTKGFIVVRENESGIWGFDKTITKTEQLIKNIANREINKLFVEAFSFSNDFYKIGNDSIGPLWKKEISENSPYDFYKNTGGLNSKFKLKNNAEDYFEEEIELIKQVIEKGASTFVVKQKNGSFRLFCQMTPESVAEKCNMESIPLNLEKTIIKMSLNGLKCVCYAFKKLSENELKSTDLENGMTFLGIYLLQPDYFENWTVLSKQFEESKLKTTVLSKEDLSDTLYLLKSSFIISNKKPVIFVPKQKTYKMTSWMKIEFNNIQNKIIIERVNESEATGVANIGTGFLSKNSFVFEGEAACKILSNETEENCRCLLENTVAFVNLTETHRIKILQIYCEVFPANKLGFLFKRLKNTSVLKLPIVSFAFGLNSLHTPASFLISKVEISKAFSVLKEGRSSHFFTSTIFQYLIFFISLQFVGMFVLMYKQTTFALNQLLYLDFFVLFGIVISISFIRKTDYIYKKTVSTVISKKQLVKISVVLAMSAVLMIINMLLLWKVPYYDSPMELAEDNDKHPYPDKYFYFEPFLVFWMVATYSVVFVLLLNRKIFFSGNFQQKHWFFLYTFFVAGLSLLFLFLHRFKLKRYFVHRLTILLRVPYLFGGFDSIIFLKLIFDVVLIYFGFALGRFLSKKIVSNVGVKSGRRIELEVVRIDGDAAISEDSSSLSEGFVK